MQHPDPNQDTPFMVISLAAAVLVLIGSMLLLLQIAPQSTKNGQFTVVDRYKDCDVIQYTDPSNRFHYFLTCSQQQ